MTLVNPFLQASLSVIDMMTQIKAGVGKASVSTLEFPGNAYILQVGVTGALKGQVMLSLNEEEAKLFASKMMMGMPITELDAMAISALCELSNMIMGHAATIFSSQGIVMDITPPIFLHGENLLLQTDTQALKVPLQADGKELLALYVCVGKE